MNETQQPHSEEDVSGLTARFTREQAENIDNKNSKRDLRVAVDFWSCLATDERNARIGIECGRDITAIEKILAPRVPLIASESVLTPKGEQSVPAPDIGMVIAEKLIDDGYVINAAKNGLTPEILKVAVAHIINSSLPAPAKEQASGRIP